MQVDFITEGKGIVHNPKNANTGWWARTISSWGSEWIGAGSLTNLSTRTKSS